MRVRAYLLAAMWAVFIHQLRVKCVYIYIMMVCEVRSKFLFKLLIIFFLSIGGRLDFVLHLNACNPSVLLLHLFGLCATMNVQAFRFM